MPSETPLLRNEQAGDTEAIADLVTAAFGQPAEALLIDDLRRAGALRVSVVATQDGVIRAHAAASPMAWASGGQAVVFALAPVAVAPVAQGRGLGRAVVKAAIIAATNQGAELLTVLGDPGWYAGFGFVPADTTGLSIEGYAFGDAFRILELKLGVLQHTRGSLRWHAAFDPLLLPPAC